MLLLALARMTCPFGFHGMCDHANGSVSERESF